jgi:hypothetical protein
MRNWCLREQPRSRSLPNSGQPTRSSTRLLTPCAGRPTGDDANHPIRQALTRIEALASQRGGGSFDESNTRRAADQRRPGGASVIGR